MFTTYVLKSLKNSRLYTGSTNDLKRRLIEHNKGQSKYTKLTKPFKLIYKEDFKTRSEEIKRELYLKTGKGRDYLKRVVSSAG